MKNQPAPATPLPIKINCTNCAYSVKVPPKPPAIVGSLVCCEGPPQMVLMYDRFGNAELNVRHPPVNETVVCGRHRPNADLHRLLSETQKEPSEKSEAGSDTVPG